jgi:hypothetical protein
VRREVQAGFEDDDEEMFTWCALERRALGHGFVGGDDLVEGRGVRHGYAFGGAKRWVR